MDFILWIRKADEMGINFWLRLLALGLCVSLFLLMVYYFLFINRKDAPAPVITTNPAAEKRQTDAALSGRVRSAIVRTKRLYNLNIGIENNDGNIVLTGDVPSEIDKELAGKLAQETPGVKDVRNELQVTPLSNPANETAPLSNPSVNVEDLEMEANLRESLQTIPELKTQTITIKVSNRAVTLTGRVANDQQRARAEQLIRTSPKVTSVNNLLRVGN